MVSPEVPSVKCRSLMMINIPHSKCLALRFYKNRFGEIGWQ